MLTIYFYAWIYIFEKQVFISISVNFLKFSHLRTRTVQQICRITGILRFRLFFCLLGYAYTTYAQFLKAKFLPFLTEIEIYIFFQISLWLLSEPFCFIIWITV